jgi:hypothetical protein
MVRPPVQQVPVRSADHMLQSEAMATCTQTEQYFTLNIGVTSRCRRRAAPLAPYPLRVRTVMPQQVQPYLRNNTAQVQHAKLARYDNLSSAQLVIPDKFSMPKLYGMTI